MKLIDVIGKEDYERHLKSGKTLRLFDISVNEMDRTDLLVAIGYSFNEIEHERKRHKQTISLL